MFTQSHSGEILEFGDVFHLLLEGKWRNALQYMYDQRFNMLIRTNIWNKENFPE